MSVINSSFLSPRPTLGCETLCVKPEWNRVASFCELSARVRYVLFLRRRLSSSLAKSELEFSSLPYDKKDRWNDVEAKITDTNTLSCEDLTNGARRRVFSGLLADARWILGLAREPAAEAVVGFQITDLPLVGHGILQDADQAHSYRWPRVILGFIEFSCELIGRD
jgi:hypothetical protein